MTRAAPRPPSSLQDLRASRPGSARRRRKITCGRYYKLGSAEAAEQRRRAASPAGTLTNELDAAPLVLHGVGSVTRVPSGSTSTYANGVAAATGSYYARLGQEPPPPHNTGGKPWFVRPYTDFGGDTSAFFPPGGYSNGVDIYLDVPYAQTHPDTRFDWSSEINDATGSFRRDLVFNVGTDATGFVITGGNNANRCSADPYTVDPSHAPRINVTGSGWYTFKHIFTGVPGGPLTVILQVIDQSTNALLGTWIRSDRRRTSRAIRRSTAATFRSDNAPRQ